MFGISMWELLVVGLILFLVVGPAKLPGLAKTIGQGIKDLKRSLNDVKGTVDKDDEFVKAVKEARQSVAEAREAVRSIFDDVDEEPERAPPLAETDPPPRASPRGRALVRPGREETKALTPGAGTAGTAGSGPALDEEPVEAEVWRADAISAPARDRDEAEPTRGASPKAVPAGTASPEDAPVLPARAAPPPGDGPPATEDGPRGRTGRRMVRPGQPRPKGGGSPSGSA